MDKIKIILTAFLLSLSGQVNANLIDRGNGLIYDESLDVTWLDLSIAPLYYNQASIYVRSLEYAGFDDWRLPSTISGNRDFDNELRSLFQRFATNDSISPLSSIEFNLNYWSDIEWREINTGNIYAFTQIIRQEGADLTSRTSSYRKYSASLFGVIAVRSGDVSVPEPSILALMFTGLFGLGLARRRFGK